MIFALTLLTLSANARSCTTEITQKYIVLILDTSKNMIGHRSCFETVTFDLIDYFLTHNKSGGYHVGVVIGLGKTVEKMDFDLISNPAAVEKEVFKGSENPGKTTQNSGLGRHRKTQKISVGDGNPGSAVQDLLRTTVNEEFKLGKDRYAKTAFETAFKMCEDKSIPLETAFIVTVTSPGKPEDTAAARKLIYGKRTAAASKIFVEIGNNKPQNCLNQVITPKLHSPIFTTNPKSIQTIIDYIGRPLKIEHCGRAKTGSSDDPFPLWIIMVIPIASLSICLVAVAVAIRRRRNMALRSHQTGTRHQKRGVMLTVSQEDFSNREGGKASLRFDDSP